MSSCTSESDGSQPDEIVLRVKVPDFDMSEVRAIKENMFETGFITVDELRRLQEVGFHKPLDMPPKPMQKGRRLRERMRREPYSLTIFA